MQQQQQQNDSEIINDVSDSPSFNCYFSDHLIATAAIKVSHESSNIIHEDEFEFFPVANDEIHHLVVEEVDHKVSGVFCFSRPKKTDFVLTKCNKSSSTGTGLRKWRIKNLLKRSDSEGNESVFFLWFKKVTATPEVSKRNRKVHSQEMAGKLKTTSFHEVSYVQKREEQKGEKMKSFLPYKQDLLARAFC